MKSALFDRFSIDLTLEQALSASHPGRCDDDVAALIREPEIARQLDAIPADDIRTELRGYGAWDEKELADEGHNRERIVWLAASDIRDAQPPTEDY